MAIAACPLDDDRGACKLIPVQFVVLCSVDDLFCALRSSGGVKKKKKRLGEISRTAHDCHTCLDGFFILFFNLSACSFALICTRGVDRVCLHIRFEILKKKKNDENETDVSSISFLFGSAHQRGCGFVSAPTGGD